MFNDYSEIVSEAEYEIKCGEGLKKLTPKQMLQRLPIALAQIQLRNTFENLQNEITQITYSLYQAREIAEKVYNEFNKCVIQKWVLYLWILKSVKYLILIDY